MRTILLVVAAFMLTSCNKDDQASACQKLEGRWQGISWKEDNEEFFGDTIFITSNSIEFKKLEDNQGDLEWNIDYILGGDEMIIGSYTVNENCDQVIITPKAGAASSYHFTIDGDELTLVTDDNNVHIVQVYQRD